MVKQVLETVGASKLANLEARLAQEGVRRVEEAQLWLVKLCRSSPCQRHDLQHVRYKDRKSKHDEPSIVDFNQPSMDFIRRRIAREPNIETRPHIADKG